MKVVSQAAKMEAADEKKRFMEELAAYTLPGKF